MVELDRNRSHSIALQWKKIGTRISKWIISETNVGGIGHSLAALADNENLWYFSHPLNITHSLTHSFTHSLTTAGIRMKVATILYTKSTLGRI